MILTCRHSPTPPTPSLPHSLHPLTPQPTYPTDPVRLCLQNFQGTESAIVESRLKFLCCKNTTARKSLQLASSCAQIMEPEPYCSVFNAQKTHPGCHTSVSEKQPYRSQKARLLYVRTLLELQVRSLMD